MIRETRCSNDSNLCMYITAILSVFCYMVAAFIGDSDQQIFAGRKGERGTAEQKRNRVGFALLCAVSYAIVSYKS